MTGPTDEWHSKKHRQPPEDLLKYGPTWPVLVAGQNGGQPVEARALIDTGAEGTVFGPKLADRLALPAIDVGEFREAGREPVKGSIYVVRISIPGLMDIDNLEVGTLPYLAEPHDMIIGRDILASCRLFVDFVAGETYLLVKSAG